MSADHVLFPRASLGAAMILAMLLVACGGGGGDSSSAPASATPAATPTTTATPTPTGTATTGSTALRDNTVSGSASFSNFRYVTVTVPVEKLSFVGARRFVKVARADGAVVFLGEVAPAMPFSLKVQAPLGSARFKYEVFSDSASDQIVYGEVSV